MLIKNIRITFILITLFFFSILTSYSQCNITKNIIYIKFDFYEFASSGYILNENFIEKRDLKNVIIFSKGIDTMSRVDKFVFDKKKRRFKKMNFTELNKIQFGKITDLKDSDSIYIIEITENKDAFMYPFVEWKMEIYKE